MLDTGWDHDGWPDATKHEIVRLLGAVDVFVPSAAEAEAISGEPDPADAAASLSSSSGGWIVVKLGADGCIAAGPDGSLHRVPAPVVDVVDTTGAGDAFNAGLIDALVSGRSVPEGLPAAIALASAVVGRPSGDRYPSAAEIAAPS